MKNYRLLLLLCYLIAPSAGAEDSPGVIDTTYSQISSRVRGLGNQIDSFFGTTRADDQLNRSTLRLSQSYNFHAVNPTPSDPEIRLNLNLPNLDRHVKTVDSYFRERLLRIIKTNETAPNEMKNPAEIGPEEKDPWTFNVDGGVKLAYPPNYFARGRARKNYQFFSLIHRFATEIAWYTKDLWQNTLTYQSDYSISNTLLFRFSNDVVWQISHRKFTTSHGPSLFQTINPQNALSYDLRNVAVVENNSWSTTNYLLSMSLRSDVYRSWFYAELTPRLNFPKDRYFHREFEIFLRLEALFGPGL